MNLSDLDLKYDAVTIVAIDNNNILIATMNEDYMSQIGKYFRNQSKNYRFSPAYKSGNWDGFIRFLKNDGQLPRGLLKECLEKLEEWKIKYELHPSLKERKIDISDFEDVINEQLIDKQKGTSLIPWEHQWESAKAMVGSRRGIVKAATSSGKSYIVSMAVKYLTHKKYVKKVLLVVPRADLVLQFSKDAEEYGFSPDEIGMYFGRVKDSDKPFLIATWQTLQNIEDRDFFEEIDCLIIDECHMASSGDKSSKSKRANIGTQMRQICDKCINASWRFGCTGTLPNDPLEVRTIISGLGPIVYEVKAMDLMEKGHISKLKIIIPFISYDKSVVKEKINQYLLEEGIDENTSKEDIPITAKFNAEKKFIENYVPRLKLISSIVKSRLEKDENILILANTLNFGEKIFKTLQFLNKGQFDNISYISGQMNEYDRKDIRQNMEENKRTIIIATTSLFSTGISVKNLHTVIFGNIGKSKMTVLQSVGRSLRQHATKKIARIYDLCDNLKYNVKHSQERMEHYASEKFDVKIEEITI
jgi:superfamily II DNA or RNA helicase